MFKGFFIKTILSRFFINCHSFYHQKTLDSKLVLKIFTFIMFWFRKAVMSYLTWKIRQFLNKIFVLHPPFWSVLPVKVLVLVVSAELNYYSIFFCLIVPTNWNFSQNFTFSYIQICWETRNIHHHWVMRLTIWENFSVGVTLEARVHV